MAELAKSDIFFFITGAAVIILTVLVIVALFYVIKILSDIRKISNKVREESDRILDDVDLFRENIKKGGTKVKHIITNAVPKKKKASRSKKTKDT